MTNPFYKFCDYMMEQERQYQLEYQNKMFKEQALRRFEDNCGIWDQVREDVYNEEGKLSGLMFDVFNSTRLAKRSLDDKVQELIHGK